MEHTDEEKEKNKLRAVRTSFFNHILKRPNSKPQSISYEDTAAEPFTSMSSGKRLKFLSTKPGDAVDFDDAQPNIIIHFYDPELKAPDAHGRTLDDILEWADSALENSHNYIQMLFPLPEGSPFNYEAPIINREVMEAFHGRPELRARLKESFVRILDFYGFELLEEVNDQIDGRAPEVAQKEIAEVRPEIEEKQEAETRIVDDDNATTRDQAEASTGESLTTQVVEPSSAPMIAGGRQPESGPAISEDNRSNQASTHTSDQIADQTTITEKQVDQTASQTVESSDSKSAVPAQSTHEAVTTSTLPRVPSILVVRAPHWPKAFRNWAIRFDHNHLRITRILRCLRVLGLEMECEAYYSALKEVFNDPRIHINERSMLYWRKAVRGPLHIAPDGERIGWLRRWGEEQQSLASASHTETTK